MKVLTIKQPWADLIVTGVKDIENRTWRTNYRGRILIHTAKIAVSREDLLAYPLPALKRVIGQSCEMLEECVTGAIIGSVEITDCVMNHTSEWAEPEVWNWVLSNPIKYDHPILEVRGKLSIWDYSLEKEKSFPYSILEYLLSVGSHFQNFEQFESVQKEICKLDKKEYLYSIERILRMAPHIADKISSLIQFFRNREGQSIGTITATPKKRFAYLPEELSGLMNELEKLM